MSTTMLSTATSEHAGPSPDEVRSYLQSVFNRGEFTASERNCKFLSYVIEETLAGRADRIKAYNIAVAVFDRSDDFDPLADPIVRIEASRLRRSLELYYLTAGKNDPIHIDMPKGSYVATFQYGAGPAHEAPAHKAPSDVPVSDHPREPLLAPRAEPAPAARPAERTAPRNWRWIAAAVAVAVVASLIVAITAKQTWLDLRSPAAIQATRGPSVMIVPFENVGADPSQDFVARGLTYELINRLTRYDDLFVFGPETSFGGQKLPAYVAASVRADYLLSGSVQTNRDSVRVSAILSDTHTGQSVWSSSVEQALTTGNLADIEGDIARQVVDAVAGPYGAVFDQTLQGIESKSTSSLKSFECVAKFRQQWRERERSGYSGTRACLARALTVDPAYAPAYSSLALLELDEYRAQRGQGDADVPRTAMDLALKAVALDPDAGDGYLALSKAYWSMGDADRGITTAKLGLTKDPHNAYLLTELGVRYAAREEWDLARPLLAQAVARDPLAADKYHLINFRYYYMRGEYNTALSEALLIGAPHELAGYAARAMAYAQLGDERKAAAAVTEIIRIDPGYGDHVQADLAFRGQSPAIIQATVAGLEKAGLRVPIASATGQ